jgi:Ser/Thr protein kinase RdoA (MazF antagonist)
MALVELVLEVAGDLVGGPVGVVDTLVDHRERCVLEVVLGDGRGAVVKGDLDAERSEREAGVLVAAGSAGVPVPSVLTRAAGSPAVLVLERVAGGWLAPDRPDRAWQAAGAALRSLHGTLVPGLPGLAGERDWEAGVERVLAYGQDTGVAAGLPADTVATVRPRAGRLVAEWAATGRDATLHGDCMPIHVRLDGADRVVGLLDLGDACRGDAAWDIAVLTLRSPERLPAVLDGYGADRTLRRWVERSWPVYRAVRLVAEVGWLADHGYDPAPGIREATTASRRLGA